MSKDIIKAILGIVSYKEQIHGFEIYLSEKRGIYSLVTNEKHFESFDIGDLECLKEFSKFVNRVVKAEIKENGQEVAN